MGILSFMSPQKQATVVSTVVASILTIVKLMLGIMSGSVAVLASAIDSLLDMSISVFNFYAIKKSEENANDEYQYGKGKIQAIAAVIEGTVITISGIYIIYQAIDKLVNGGELALLAPSIVAMVFSIVATYFLVKYLLKVAKDTDNLVIKADALHYETDLWSNAVVLLALALVYITGLDVIDAVFGLGIGVYIMYSAYEIIREGIEILLDRALDIEELSKIRDIISSDPNVTSYHWLKTRTDGTTNFVEFHLVLSPKMLLKEAHEITDSMEAKIIALDSKKRWLITPHYDPYDDQYNNEIALNGKR